MQTFSAVQAIAGSMAGMPGFAQAAGAGASALSNGLGLGAEVDPGPGVGSGQAPFADLLKKAVTDVQSLENQAADEVQGLMTGHGVDVHDAMIATEKADLSFEAALAVRGKAVAAYQAMMQMQF